ncbi:tetratricopeptide repeat-containing sensor histidine kinase [Halosquirtibacter laminarini]|uniref:Tetratricopeptide repeat-containing sensor histidine kinase n=1 Tax=Halosquirtibacter laminarini TaxID=3374600 RepID=A0AC61NHA8_9BACT|nr:tetratricopeptide repeat-containing sensor histidine kinase [Prolixibacteraceae bacterium]
MKQNPDSCMVGVEKYFQELINPNEEMVFRYNWVMGKICSEKTDYNEAIGYYETALEYHGLDNNQRDYYSILEAQGMCYFHLSKYNNSLELLGRCLRYQNKNKNAENQKTILQEISLNYIMMGDFNSAGSFITDAINIECNGKKMMRFDASLYNSMGRIKGKQKKHLEAIDKYNKSIEIYKELEDKNAVASVHNNIAFEYLALSNHQKALEMSQSALNTFQDTDYSFGEASAYGTIANIYSDMKLWKLAKSNAERSYFIAKKYKFLFLEENFYNIMVHLYESTKNYKDAFTYMKKLKQLTIDRYNISKQEYIRKVETSYEKQKILKDNLNLQIEKKERVLELKQKSLEKDVFLFLFLTFVAIFLIIIRRYILKVKHTDALKEKNLQILDQNRELEELNSKYVEANTALYQSEREHEKSKKETDNVFSIITHDLRSPVSSIMGINELIKEDYDEMSKEEMKPLLLEVYKSINNLECLLTNLLSWSRVRTGNLKALKKSVSLDDVVDDAYCELMSEIQEKEIDFRVDIDSSICVYIDDRIFNKVLVNVIRNAIKYSFRKGIVSVSVKDDSLKYVTLYIRDNGLGIDKKEQYMLFKNDMPIIRKGTSGEKGTGLGLRVCSAFMKVLEGDILLDSTLGGGTTVMIKLLKFRAQKQ